MFYFQWVEVAMRCWGTLKLILSFLPQSPKSLEHQVPYWPGDWIAKEWTVLCVVIALNKLSQLNQERFTHPGLIAIIILVEFISDKWT